ncbi:MAG: CoB--CoM heterodisulfide reductase iron-sulfur subunit B family protein [Candidatus Bathyarchaeota archaeon]|nr:MAG: CoB--CoM heterodisulfide reductase iron-sulfur subunit B family protein [Candidatus Bathyarchaeota archaeon]
MKVAVYWGCKIPTAQYAYEMSLRQVLPHLDIELIDLKNTSCCGGPVRSVNTTAALFLSARNLALSNQTGTEDLLVPCNECHFMLSEAKHRIDNDAVMREKMQELLSKEDLAFSPRVRIWHVIDLLHDMVKVDSIKAKVKKPLSGLKFAVHPGCQIIRPSEIKRVDHSEKPRKLDILVEALGAETLDYPEKLDCCGAALLYSHEDAALSLTGSKLKALQDYDVDGFVDSCPYCHTLYDARQKDSAAMIGGNISLSVFYYTQLLGLALKLGREELGLHLNQSFNPEKFKF